MEGLTCCCADAPGVCGAAFSVGAEKKSSSSSPSMSKSDMLGEVDGALLLLLLILLLMLLALLAASDALVVASAALPKEKMSSKSSSLLSLFAMVGMLKKNDDSVRGRRVRAQSVRACGLMLCVRCPRPTILFNGYFLDFVSVRNKGRKEEDLMM